jgi:predicted neuraminidase
MSRLGSRPSPDLTIRVALAVAAALAMLAFWAFGMVHRQAPGFAPPAEPSTGSAAPRFLERFASNGETPEVHAATAYADGDGLTAFWYGGTREGARDVAIYQARLVGDQWEKPRAVVQRRQMKSELNRHVRKIGNPIVYRHPDGRIWLFFVTVSVGGWAGSAISLSESVDNGETWSRARRLVTSPFFNLSTLVKGSAIRYADGTIGLPVYHEFLGKFGEMLRIGPEGRVLDKTRFTTGRHALQPEIAILGPRRAVGILRYAGEAPRRVLYMVTDDAGRTWSQPQKIHLPNPDSAVELLALGGGRLLGVFNDLEEARWRLVLGVSDNLGKDWRTIKVLEQQQDPNDVNRYQFSYPWILRAADGDFHLLYSWNRTRIKHIEFNQSWLEQATAASHAAAANGNRPR